MPGLVTPLATPTSMPKRRRALPAVWMRAGTSKGLYLHRQDLPSSVDDWAAVITRVMGSYDSDPKQLNGIGGATSTTSKVAVVSPSKRPGVDVDYTFVQVPIGTPKLDMTGNCGNIASGVGPFAVDEGLVKVQPGETQVSSRRTRSTLLVLTIGLQVQVRVYNTNTKSVMVETVQVDEEGHFVEDGDCALPGLSSTGSRVQMTFAKPSGAMTGKLLPSGRPMDVILVQTSLDTPPVPVRVSLVDAANPFCWVDESSLPDFFREQGPGADISLAFIEDVRREAAILMGLATSVEEAALTRGTPKIAVLTEPGPRADASTSPDIQVVAYSMGKPHGSLQLTGAVCLGTAACTEGTIAHAIRNKVRSGAESFKTVHRKDSNTSLRLDGIRLLHPGGDMEVDVLLDSEQQAEEVTVFRTARRLFEGTVYYLQ
jgi:2-methylaconitate cis-trans-isomerase PrpF